MSHAELLPPCLEDPESEHTSLESLVTAHAQAQLAGNELQILSIESAFAHCFWQAELADTRRAIDSLPDALLGSFYRLHRDVAKKLGFHSEAHESAMSWMVWASDRNNMAEYWRARARLAEDEAARFVDFISPAGSETADDSDIPLISRMSSELTSQRATIAANSDDARLHRAMIDALVRIESCTMTVRRPDKAAKLQEVIRTLAKREPRPSLSLRATLMEARALHFRGDVAQAARLCATTLKNLDSDLVVSSLLLRDQLAEYSIETEHFDTALRMWHSNVAVAASKSLDVEHLLAARKLCLTMAHAGQTEELIPIAHNALSDCADFPTNAPLMELRLLLADEYLATGEPERSLNLAETAANWFSANDNQPATAHGCRTAASAAMELGDLDQAAVFFTDLARVRDTYDAPVSAAETLSTAATDLAGLGASADTVDALLAQAAEYAVQTWDKALWNESAALIQWARWNDQSARDYAEAACELFLDSNLPADAARALTVAASAAMSVDDHTAAVAYAQRIEQLVPERHPVRESMHRILDGA